MKKILCLITIMCLLVMATVSIKVHAVSAEPTYDASFNLNKGAFYANGTDITISQDGENTVIRWSNGSQEVPKTVSVFGGGSEGTSYESSNIVMEGGTVSYIYGGGLSLNSNNISNVTTSNIQVNDGTVLQVVFGGGFLYSQVDTSNVVINGGIVSAVQGGRSCLCTSE